MFIANYPLKNMVQKAVMFLHLPLSYGTMHPYRALQRRALSESMDFIVSEMPEALSFDTPRELLVHASKAVTLDGAVAEFGVNKGGTIRFIAAMMPDRIIDGFDSFKGLPEDWRGNMMSAGQFDRRGRLPRVPANVRLHRGWFDETLPAFAAQSNAPLALLHIDCDLYSSTRSIFTHLEDRIAAGTVIVFDEYFNYPAWQMHEHRAFREFLDRTGRRCRYIGYAYQQVAVVIE
ncbi:MAG: class I SAM-dependent methyltransferase [Hyphomicrobiales bacterium]|nr:class I SAM-dependent methyltransferase [Hyphomicrobiales bacterium]